MPRLFISYSRVDHEFTERLVVLLRRVYGLPNVWYDDELTGGVDRWQEILRQIDQADIFIYLLSNESVESPYCQAEFTEAARLQKPIITVQVRDRTQLSPELQPIQYIQMADGPNNQEGFGRLTGSINRIDISKQYPAKWTPETPLPQIPSSDDSRAPRPDVDTAVLALRQPVTAAPRAPGTFGTRRGLISAALAVVGLILGILLISALNGANNPPTSEPTPTNNVAAVLQVDSPTPTDLLTNTEPLTETLVPPTSGSSLNLMTPDTSTSFGSATPDSNEPCQATPSLGIGVNIRAGAGADFTLLILLPVDASASVIAKSSDYTWVRVNYSGLVGWVAADAINLSGNCTGVPAFVPTATMGIVALGTAAAKQSTPNNARLDYQVSPDGEVDLSGGFSPDPYRVGIINGDENVDVSYLGNSCSGLTTTTPALRINYSTDGLSPLRIYFVATSGDASLVVHAPDDNFYCVDDSFGTINPTVDFNIPSSGTYDIWIGSDSTAIKIRGTLFITGSSRHHP